MPHWMIPLLFLPFSVTWNLTDASIEYVLFHPSARSSFMAENGYSPFEGVNLDLNTELAPGVFWDNTIKSMTDRSQYRYIAWEFKMYVRPIESLEIGYHHESEHILDGGTIRPFPLSDSLRITWKIYSNPKPRKAWFNF
jgi:hypothetical protein